MANYTSTANVILSVNGKQAQKMLSTLEKDAQRLERQLAKAASAGDKATMKKLQRELNQTKRIIDQLKGSSASVDNVLRRLDSASPKELNSTLKTLQKQLNGIQRGTAAWDAHVAKIKAVKAELQRVNATMATQRSMWDRMNLWLNNCQTAILGIAAAITGQGVRRSTPLPRWTSSLPIPENIRVCVRKMCANSTRRSSEWTPEHHERS